MALQFNLDDEEVKKKAQKLKEKKDSGGGNYAPKPLSLNKNKTYLLILPSNSKTRKEPYFETYHYDIGSKQNYRRFASAAAIEDRDDVMDLKKKLYGAFKDKIDAKTKPYASLATAMGIRKGFMVNAVKLKVAKGKLVLDEVGVVKLPKPAENLFLSDLGDYGVKKVCHPDFGKVMIIEGNGKDGFDRRYEVAKWKDGKALLLKKGIVSEEDLEDGMSELEEQQTKFSIKGIKEFIKRLKANDNYKKLIAKLEAMEDEEEDDDFANDDDSEMDDDLELNNDTEDDLDDDDLDNDDDELEDDDLDGDDDDGLDDDLEDDDELSDDDDELGDDDELDDDLEDEEEEVDVPALKKEVNAKIKKYKASKNTKVKAKLKKEIAELKKTIKENS